MLLVALEPHGGIEVRCTDADHDFSRVVLTVDDVKQARLEHDESQEGLRAPGFYVGESRPGMQPTTYRKEADGHWWAVHNWQRLTGAPRFGSVGYVGPIPEVFER